MESYQADHSSPQPLRPSPAAMIAHAHRPQPTALSATPDALSLLRALRRRWVLAVGLGLLLAGTVGPAVWYLVPRAKYSATATLRIATNPKRIIFEPHENLADFGTFQRTQVALIRNRKVLSHALGKLAQAQLTTLKELDDQEGWLEQHLQVGFANGSEILEISLSGDHPEDLAKIVNQIVSSYMELVVDEEHKARLARLDQLKGLWAKYQGDLEDKRKALKQLAASVGGHDPIAVALGQQFKTENLAVARRELMRVQNEMHMAQSRLATQKAKPVKPVRAVTRAPAYDPNVDLAPEVVELQHQVADMERAYRSVSRIAAKANDTILVRASRNLAEARKRLAETRAAIRDDLARRRGPMEPPVAAATDATVTRDQSDPETQVAVLQAYQEALTKDVDRLTEELKTTSQGGLDLEKDREAIAISAEVARKVGAEVEAVSVEQGAPDRVQRLAEAKVPKRRDETKKIKAGGVAALGAFAFALLGVSFWEFLARRVDTPDELVSGLGMKLVGALPALPGRSRRASGTAALADQHWRSVLVESVDATRTLLLHASRLESVRVVMVTSAVKGEGKTSLSCHLATSLARAGHRTLLVDCDLRSPAAHRPFDLPRGPGLCEILRGELEPADAIRETHALGLDLLAAGQGDALALQAIARNGLQPIFKTLEAHYDFIIVDTPPILPVVDSLLIGQNVDGVVFSVMRDVSRLPQVYAAYERLAGLGAKMLGVVVSGVSSDTYRSHYYTVAQTDQ